jgi:hypothetical protein
VLKTFSYTVLVLAACAHPPPPATQATPESRTITGRIVYADSATIDSLRKAHPPDPSMEAFTRRFDSLAVLVDTIVVVSPDSIVLHVGQVVEHIVVLIHTQARRASGEILPTYPGFMQVEDTSIAQSREAGLTGLKVGRTRVVITVMNRNAHAPPSYVPVVVIP